MTNVVSMVKVLKEQEADFEWYPTTMEMLDVIRADMRGIYNPYDRDEKLTCSVLDIGAGNGSALEALTFGKKYAIEKSKPLLNSLDKKIVVVGTEFMQNTLIDKRVDVCFSNPPYSEYSPFSVKIISEANAEVVYLVIPQRWKDNEEIQAALESRKATAEVIYSGDFLNADRKARAKIDIVKVSLSYDRHSLHHSPRCKVEPFALWFNNHFKLKAVKTKQSDFAKAKRATKVRQESIEKSTALIEDKGLVKTLETLYNADMDKLINTYMKLNELESDLLDELDVSLDNVSEALSLKITGLKDFYWKELFSNLGTITDKLATSSRSKMLEQLFAATHIDFNAANAHALVLWCIKNANTYFDDQLIELVTKMTEQSNVELYKSNKRTFGKEDWRYSGRKPEHLDRYKLDYRIVVTRTGGINTPSWAYQNTAHNLTENCANFFSDILTIASNLGFDTSIALPPKQREWESNKKQVFSYFNHDLGRVVELFEARAFKNGNAHIKFNQDFILRLNVEFGRLSGWLKSASQASDELGLEPQQAAEFFNCNLQLASNNIPLLAAA